MSGMGLALNNDSATKKKSPADFLGANANLVNLDNLVSKPVSPGPSKTETLDFASACLKTDNSSTTNPFGAPTNNPFGPQLQQQQQAQRVPLNQMIASQQMGFSQPPPATILPTPLLPVGNAPPMQPQGNNPFL
jgi:hypothetical protein